MTYLVDQLVEADDLEKPCSQEIDERADDEDSQNDTEAVRDKYRRVNKLGAADLLPDEVTVDKECMDIKYTEGGFRDFDNESSETAVLDLDVKEECEDSHGCHSHRRGIVCVEKCSLDLVVS